MSANGDLPSPFELDLLSLFSLTFLTFFFFPRMSDGEQTTDKKIEHINIKVVQPDSTEIAFKIKRNTVFKKLIDAFHNKTGLVTFYHLIFI